MQGGCGNDRPCEEVAQVHELAVLSVLHVDNAPAVLASSDRFTVDDYVVLRTDDGKGDDLLQRRDKFSKR